MYISVDVDTSEVIGEMEHEIEKIVRLASDAEITKQFETIQKELEGVILRHVNEKIDTLVDKAVTKQLSNLKVILDVPSFPVDCYLESGEGIEGKERAMKAASWNDADLKKAEEIRDGWRSEG